MADHAEPKWDAPAEPRFYGRRRGKKLRQIPLGLLETLLPRLEIKLQPGQGLPAPSSLFAQPVKALWLEVGFGGGEHLADQAQAHGDIGMIGCEVFQNGIASLLRHVDERGLGNVRVWPEDARRLFPALADGALDRIFVLFPDPWPKARHAARRFIGPDNLPELARLLADNGELRVASDDPIYQEWAAKHLETAAGFEPIQVTTDRALLPNDWPQTRYEKKCLANRAPVFFRYRRKPRG